MVGDIEGALKAFKNKYWSTSQQLALTQRILLGRYVVQNDGTMSDYVAKCYQENNFLDNPMPEREFVTAMAAHFNNQIERELRVSLIRTVEQLLQVLDEIEASGQRVRQRAEVRSQGEEARRGSRLFKDQRRSYPRPGPQFGRESEGIPKYYGSPNNTPVTVKRGGYPPVPRENYVQRNAEKKPTVKKFTDKTVNF